MTMQQMFGLAFCSRLRSDDSMRTTIILLSVCLIGVSSCSPATGYRQPERGRQVALSSIAATPFEKLWAERTISFGQTFGGAGTSPFTGPGGGGELAFPLIVRATFMDSILIEAGIKEFGRLASMSDEELNRYRASYRSAHNLDDKLFVWVELQTSFSEEYLQLGRWTLFLEDENKHQVEPTHIVEHPGGRESAIRSTSSGEERGSPLGGRALGWSAVTKDVELYLPLYRVGGEALVSNTTKSLKFVVVQSTNPSVRAEGTWDLSKFISR